MDIEKIKTILSDGPKYRFDQAMQSVFRDLISNWSEALVFPIELRQELNDKCPIDIANQIFKSKDGTVKALLTLNDGKQIETVLMRFKDERNTVCVSSQVGCPMGCAFCSTGKMGLGRNLNVGEIIDQVLFFARYLKQQSNGAEKVSNVVFMGMGEPMLNYTNVMDAIRILNNPKYFGLGIRHMSISTCGVVEGINKLAEEALQVNLAISLHAPNDELREKIMPIAKAYPLAVLFESIDRYIAKTSRKVMFEYLMLDKINDSKENALQLARLMKKPLYMVNLIAYNPTGDFNSSPKETIDEFSKILKDSGVDVTVRHSFGQDIKAACGQLAGRAD